MSAFLSDEWLTEARAALADLPSIDGADGVVQYTVSGAPEGKVQAHVVVRSGRLTSIEPGKHREPDCIVSLAYPEAVALFSGAASCASWSATSAGGPTPTTTMSRVSSSPNDFMDA